MRVKFLILSILSIVAIPVMSQIVSEGTPMEFTQEKAAPKAGKFQALGAAPSFYTSLKVDTTFTVGLDSLKRYVVGVSCPLDLTPANSGTTFTRDGIRVWRTGITSKSAAAISVVFTEFDIPEGAKLFIYNPSQTKVLGAFSSDNNNESKWLPVQPLASDSIVIEYQEVASGYAFKGNLKIGYASHLKKTNPGGGITCSPQAYITEPMNPAVSAVCMIFTTGTEEMKSWYGTGTLINNPLQKPYIITAGHVTLGKYAGTSVFFFQNHKVATDVNGSAELSMAGATQVAYAKDLDLSLIELHSMPPRDYRPYLAGWDANEENAYLNPYKCLHHPNGDFTKISYANDAVSKSYVNFDRSVFTHQSFWHVSRWEIGATQGGSSGSALFNREERIIGCLTGGSSVCENPVDDYYYQLAFAWDFYSESAKNLKSWLDPSNLGVKAMDGADPYADNYPCQRVSNFDPADNIAALQMHGGTTGYQAGHNSLGCDAYAEYYSFNSDKTLYGVYIGTYKGKYLKNSPMYVNVYTGGAQPGILLTQAVVKPTDYSYTYDGTLKESTITSLKTRDTYVRFSGPVNVGSNFYVGISFDPAAASTDTLALYQTTNRASGNFAYYQRNGSWSPFTSYPVLAQPASLWLEPVVSEMLDVSASEARADANTFSIAASDGLLKVYAQGIEAFDYVIIDLGGKMVASGDAVMTDGSAVLDFSAPQGLYIIRFSAASTSESHKFLWK